MKKKISALLALVMLVSLIGCAAKEIPPASTAPEKPAQTTPSAPAASEDPYANWPEKDIVMYCAHSAGGTTDVTARFFAEALSEYFGVGVTVKNVPGAGSETGTKEFLSADPDGYTIATISAIDLCSLASSKPAAGISFPDDFRLVANFSTNYMAYATNPNSPYADVYDFVEYAKANPGKLTVAECGASHVFTAACIMKELGIDFTTVNYDGGADAFAAVIGEHVDAASLTNSWIQRVYDGGGSMLAVGGPERSDLCPDIPTWEEVGIDISYTNPMYILATPAGVPDAIYEKLVEACDALQHDETLTQNLLGNGQYLMYKSGNELTDYMTTYYGKVDAVIKENPEIFMQ